MSDNFQFIGFEPTNELKTYSKEVFWLMEDRAPSQSAMTAIVSKIENSYHTKVKIHCSSGVWRILNLPKSYSVVRRHSSVVTRRSSLVGRHSCTNGKTPESRFSHGIHPMASSHFMSIHRFYQNSS